MQFATAIQEMLVLSLGGFEKVFFLVRIGMLSLVLHLGDIPNFRVVSNFSD